MFVHCPKCNALIGDGSDSCSECHAVFDKADKEKMAGEKSAREELAETEIQGELKDYQKKRLNYNVFMMINGFLGVAVPFVLWKATGNRVAPIVAVVFFFVMHFVLAIIGAVSGATRCPYCGTFLYRRRGLHTKCPNCGEKLTDN